MSRTLSPFSRCLWSAFTLGTIAPAVAGAQTVTLNSSDPRIARAEQLHFEYRAAESLEMLEGVIAAEPENYESQIDV